MVWKNKLSNLMNTKLYFLYKTADVSRSCVNVINRLIVFQYF